MQAISPRVTMFNKILIANRGEIACRVMTTARRMGIRTVAVYSDADANSRHVAMADEAVRIGPAPASESYLRSDRIVAAVDATGADAVHPGYGFLSENEAFAQTLSDAKVTFIGPPPSAIHAMGSKSEAKKLMERAKVPLVPGLSRRRAAARSAAEGSEPHRVPGADQGECGRWRQGHARRDTLR